MKQLCKIFTRSKAGFIKLDTDLDFKRARWVFSIVATLFMLSLSYLAYLRSLEHGNTQELWLSKQSGQTLMNGTTKALRAP